MKTKIIDNWEVELTNERGDTLTLKGEQYADFFKEYDNKQLIIADVLGQSEQLVCDCGNRLSNKELYFGQCLQCDKNIEEAN